MDADRHARSIPMCRTVLPGAGSVLAGLLLALPILARSAEPQDEGAARSLFFDGVRLFDGEGFVESADVLVADGRIVAVGPELAPPEGAERIDGAGRTLLPGWIDAHAHCWGDALERAAAFGVTTVLDQFCDQDWARAQRAEQAAGRATGRADLYSAGTVVTAPGGHCTQYGLEIPTLADAADAQAFVDARLAEGSDWIKLIVDSFGGRIPTLAPETAAAVIEAAHTRDVKALAHEGTADDALALAAAGIDGLVHGVSDRALDAEEVARLAASGLFVVSTLSLHDPSAERRGLCENPTMAARLTAAERETIETVAPWTTENGAELARGNLAALIAAGVPVLAGSDAPNPGATHGATMHRELELLVACGMSPPEALAAATSRTARLFGLEDRGRVAPGLRADLLLVAGDPSTDPRATRDILGVWKAGRAIVSVPAAAPASADAAPSAAANAAAAEPAPVAEARKGQHEEHRETWNRIFRQSRESGQRWKANEFLADVIAGVPPGRALDVGMGQGRNALFLAENGWRVTGYDLSDEAVGQAKAQAEAAGLALDALRGDVDTFDYGHERWDLVVVMYMHELVLPRAAEIVDSLAPGGLLVVEGFHRDLNVESVQGGYFGYRTNELPRAFDALRILRYEDVTDSADWGNRQSGKKPIVRFLAKKPLPTVAGLQGAYLGQGTPPKTPEVFAPGLVSTEAIELNGVLAPGGREFLFTRLVDGVFSMHRSVLENGEWTRPLPLRLYPGRVAVMAADMTVTPDGERLYWLGPQSSELLPPAEQSGMDLWGSERVHGDWSTALHVPAPVSTDAREVYPCAVADGSLYFSSDREGTLGGMDVWRAQRLPDGGFAEPSNLGAPINTEHGEGDLWVAPDESVLVLSSRRPDGLGQGDLYVAFRKPDGGWTEPVNLGPDFNTDQTEFCPMGTKDGKALFFSRRVGATWEEATASDVYWVDAAVLGTYRPK